MQGMPRKNTTSSEISQAVKEIPTLIIEEIRKKELSSLSHRETQVVGQSAKKTQHVYQSPKNSRRWMFVGVVACTLCIFGFWVVYISDLIQKNKSTINPTSSFTDSGGKDLSMLVATFSKMEDDLKDDLKTPDELKAMVAHAILPFFTSSSAVTSTPGATTTQE